MNNNYTLTIDSKQFDYFLNGTKRIEMRLNNEKRKYMNVGDKIRFFKLPDCKEYFDTKIVELIKCKTFGDLIDKYDIKYFADKDSSLEDLVKTLRRQYTIDEEKRYGVIGIRVELLSGLQNVN